MYLVKSKTTKENAQSIIKQGIRSTFLIGFRQTKDERLKIADQTSRNGTIFASHPVFQQQKAPYFSLPLQLLH